MVGQPQKLRAKLIGEERVLSMQLARPAGEDWRAAAQKLRAAVSLPGPKLDSNPYLFSQESVSLALRDPPYPSSFRFSQLYHAGLFFCTIGRGSFFGFNNHL